MQRANKGAINMTRASINSLFLTLLLLVPFIFIPQDTQGQSEVYPFEPNFGEVVLEPSDDSFTDRLPLGFEFTLYDQTYDGFWINNNGNVTFNGPLDEYTSEVFPNDFGEVLIAPFFADVDTSGEGSGVVYLNQKTPGQVVVTWDRVGYYNAKTDKLNSFQLILRDDESGDQVIFVYGDLEWTTAEGHEVVHAIAGFDGGNDDKVLRLGGAGTKAILNRSNTITVFYAPNGIPIEDTTPPTTKIEEAPADGRHLSRSTVTFEWSGSDNVTNPENLKFSYRFDLDSFTEFAQKNRLTDFELSEGPHTFELRAQDEAGHVDRTPETVSFFIDSTAPTLTLVSSLSDGEWTNQRTVTFEWRGEDEVSRPDELQYAYRLDDDRFTAFGTETSHVFENLPERQHTFEVKIRDKAGLDSTLSITFFVDEQPPDTELIAGPRREDLINPSEATFEWKGSDNLAPENQLEFSHQIDGKDFSPFGLGTSHTAIGLSDGPHIFRVKARDLAMNEEPSPLTLSFVVDADLPETTLTGGPSENDHINTNTVTFEWTGTDNRTPTDNLLFSYRFDGDEFSEFGAQKTVTSDMSEGRHTFEVRAKDEVRNIGSPITRQFVVDLTAPETEITAGPGNGTVVGLPVTFEWTGHDDDQLTPEDQLQFAYRIDDKPFSDFGAETSRTFAELSEGKHTFTVKARDLAMNEEESLLIRTFEIDTTPPTAVLTRSPLENRYISTSKVTFEWTGMDNRTDESDLLFSYRFDSDEFSEFSTQKTGTFELADGQHTFELRTRDEAGHIGMPITRQFVIDSTPPTITITTPSEDLHINTTTVKFEWTGNDDGTPIDQLQFAYHIDEEPFSDFSSETSHTLTELGEGEHTFTVKARDLTPHEMEVTRMFVIDLTPPETRIDELADQIVPQTITFRWGGDDGFSEESELLFAIQLDSGDFGEFSRSTSTIFNQLAAGEHTLAVRAKDKAGNEDLTPATVTFIVSVAIPDENLRSALGTALDKEEAAPIIPDDFSDLEDFDADERDISDLTGLEHATDLATLNLSKNSISDVSPLAGLTNINTLNLSSNQISEVSPLAGLTNLTDLNLSENRIADVSPLAGLTNLTTLKLRSNQITSLQPLVDNTGLGSGKTVDVRDNPLSNVAITTHIPVLLARGVDVRWPLIVTPSSIDFGDVTVGKPATATIRVSNKGDEPLSVTEVTSTLGEVLSIPETEFSVDPGATHELTLTLTPLVAGPLTDTVTLTSNALSSPTVEIAITANVLKKGDVNGDGVINIFDLTVVASEFQQEGENLKGDVNGDGKVNVLDLTLVASSFGG
jgi:hypothetical protein